MRQSTGAPASEQLFLIMVAQASIAKELFWAWQNIGLSIQHNNT
jgi:hypothetical protein